MKPLEYIKTEITRLYEENPHVHISVKITRPKVAVEHASAKIVGVYKNIFQIETLEDGHQNRYTFQYNDVLMGQISIEELSLAPLESTAEQA